MSYTTHDNREQFMPAHADEQLAIDVYAQRAAVLDESAILSLLEQAVSSLAILTSGVTNSDIYPTVNVAALAQQSDLEVDHIAQMAAEQVMYPDDMISRNPMPRHNEYIDTIESLNPEGKPETPPTDIDQIRAEVERAASAAVQAYVNEGMDEMEAFLLQQGTVRN